MTLGTRMREARMRAGLTQRELAQRFSVRHNTISNWEKDKSAPTPVQIERICTVLGVSPNYLVSGVEDGAVFPELPSDEIALLKRYRALDATGKGAVTALLEYYFTRQAPSEPVTRPAAAAPKAPAYRVIPGRVSTQSVAAGTGTYLDADSFEELLVADTPITRRAAFFVPVSGDSMEPVYFDGDILIVEDAPVGVGETGIFTLDGCGYVKRRGEQELLSLNPAYAPIPLKEDVYCNGRVVGVLDKDWLAV